jgi:hypothetical protein
MQALTNATTATTNSTIELILSAVPALVIPLQQRCSVELVSCWAKPAAAAQEGGANADGLRGAQEPMGPPNLVGHHSGTTSFAAASALPTGRSAWNDQQSRSVMAMCQVPLVTLCVNGPAQ